MSRTLVVLEGDETGQELLEQALRVIDPAVTGLDLSFERHDLSLATRRRTENRVVDEAGVALRRHVYGLKAATVAPPERGDVGSANALLREAMGASVILRVGRPIPGVPMHANVKGPIAIVRMAVGDAYGAKESRETVRDAQGREDEVAVRTERISRRVCRAVAETAFSLAERMEALVFGGPKFTVSPVYEGMLKEELDEAAARHPGVAYESQLIDTTYALLEGKSDRPIVVPALNRDGDCLSDLVLPWFGTIAGAESSIVSTDDQGRTAVYLAEAPHGTAPSLQGKDVANPMAMILAAAAALEAMPDAAQAVGREVRKALMQTVSDGVRTADLGGTASTTAFTDAVIDRVRAARTAGRR